MKTKEYIKRKFNHRTPEASAELILATLIISGWLVSLAAYWVAN